MDLPQAVEKKKEKEGKKKLRKSREFLTLKKQVLYKGSFCIITGMASLRILVAGERCNFTGEYCERGSMSE